MNNNYRVKQLQYVEQYSLLGNSFFFSKLAINHDYMLADIPICYTENINIVKQQVELLVL